MNDQFLEELNKVYGELDRNRARFGTSSYGDIADDLCISGSQFSKLLYGTATNGMYERSIKNLKQIQELRQVRLDKKELQTRLVNMQEELSSASESQSYDYKYYGVIVLLLLVSAFLLYQLYGKEKEPPSEDTYSTESTHVLAPYFDRDFKSDHISPFLNISDAQLYCPASAYEGVWELDKPYTIPIPGNKPGLYYVARASDVRMKCYRSVEEAKKGKVLQGFESMTHELWLDTKEEPLAPRYFNVDSKSYTKEFYNIDFEGDPTFAKIATLKSFMLNTLEIEGTQIIRKAEPAGRYADQIDHDLVNEYQIDIKDILQNVIGNMVQTNCFPAVNNNCNPNTLKENESVIKFDCQFTLKDENLGLGGSYPYSKSFRLIKQNYSNNLLCSCDEPS